MVELGEGLAVLRVSGDGAEAAFADEPGGHRWQRVPPNERRGRTHTSTVTVAVLREPAASELRIDPGDLEWRFCRGSGAGGQHRNKTETAVQLTHRPTGVSVRCETERSQQQNKQTALAMLRARIWGAERDAAAGRKADERRAQVGSGMRGDKRRAVRCQDDAVTDHRLGRTWRFSDYQRGEW